MIEQAMALIERRNESLVITRLWYDGEEMPLPREVARPRFPSYAAIEVPDVQEYAVTYELDPEEGEFEVWASDDFDRSIVDPISEKYYTICWLPREWHGRRVARVVFPDPSRIL